jgi:uncharacterized protein
MHAHAFSDEDVAASLNEHFISIKVDREERPDIDYIYMTVCQSMTGHGGWPLTIILTPEQKPFFAGTYFPKEDQYGHIGLFSLLNKVSMLWKEERERADQLGDRVLKVILTHLHPNKAGELQPEVLHVAFAQFLEQFDETYGGFGEAPKFPRPHDLLFLLRYWKQYGNEEALRMVTHTLDQMRKGGIYDHLGYGFARYAVDRAWLVPHFEKMLYDNALLAIAYLEAYQVTQAEKYAQVAREIFTYVLREMTDPLGGFYATEDADSEGEEGKFYVWTPAEIAEVLGAEEGELFCACYDVTEEGNFEQGTSILQQIHVSLVQIAQERNLSLEELEKRLARAREKLFAVREKRVHPHKDDKVLTSWNGLMIAALACGARVLGEIEYAEAAVRAVHFIRSHLTREDGRLLARYREGEAAYLAYLDDYAFLAWGLMELYEATFQVEFLEQAIDLTQNMLALFGDEQRGGLFFYGKDAEELIIRPKEFYDGATPSGNSVAAYNLMRLSRLITEEKWMQAADRQLKAFAEFVAHSPTSHSFFLLALQFAVGPSQEIVIVGDPNHVSTKEMIQVVQRAFTPAAVTVLQPIGDASPSMKYWIPNAAAVPAAKKDQATVYLCESFACQAPITDVEELARQLRMQMPQK